VNTNVGTIVVEVKFQVPAVTVVRSKCKTLCLVAVIEHAIWNCVKSITGNLWTVKLIHKAYFSHSSNYVRK